MATEITAASQINFDPATVQQEVVQNVATLLGTLRYSVPYDRSFGLSALWLDDPTPTTRAKLTAEVVAQVRRYEPRATVEEVLYDEDQDEGRLKPRVRVSINAG